MDTIKSKAIELAKTCLKKDSINQMLDDFSTDTLIEYTPKLNELERKMVSISEEIIKLTE